MDPRRTATSGSFSRRTILKAIGAAGLGASLGSLLQRPGAIARADSKGNTRDIDWQGFDAAVGDAMQTFGVVGTAIAAVNAQGIVHAKTFGVRDLVTGAPVTPNTLFRVGSTTKSMTSLLVGTFVDDGTLAWDQPVIDLWPNFRAPTDNLTRTLRVRDLMGMDSGIGAPPATDLHQDYPTALELLQSVAFLPVLGPPHTTYFYNNTVYASAGYLPLLARGADADTLQSAYTSVMQDRVYGPAGMQGARIADDPRPFTDDYATGYALDLVAGTFAEPWVPVGSFAPVGASLANLTDMAVYLHMQLNHGMSASGTRVVSDANLAECWKPHIDVPTDPALDPNSASMGYAMGWIKETYTDGRSLVWHNGAVDGFTAYIGFFPDDDLGLVVLSNIWEASGGLLFYLYVLNLLLSQRFGLSIGVNDRVVSQYQDATRQLLQQAAQAVPVDRLAIAPYLGLYEHGYRLAFDATGVLRLRQGARNLRLLAMPDGSYLFASGLLAGTAMHLDRDSAGRPQMEIEGAETVLWSSA